MAIHFIDLSDHFQHQDKSITKINFLRYSEKEWNKIAGNEFAYTNRMRVEDYLTLFDELTFDIWRQETEVDDDSLNELNNGFKVHDKFISTAENICTSELKVMMQSR